MMKNPAADPAQSSCEARLYASPEIVSESLDLLRSTLVLASRPLGPNLRVIRAKIGLYVLAVRYLPALIREIGRLSPLCTDTYCIGWHDGRQNGLEVGEEHRKAIVNAVVEREQVRIPGPIVVDARILDLHQGGRRIG